MRQSRRLTLHRLTLFSCMFFCCALVAHELASAGAGASASQEAPFSNPHADPVAGFMGGWPGADAPSFLRAASPLRALVPGGTPYTGTALPIPGTIQAEDFDNGGEGVAYHDTNVSNDGGYYRSTGVDITSTYAGPNVGWTQVDEWMEYTVQVAVTSTYKIEVIAATPQNTGNVHVEIDGANVTGNMPIPNTGGWGNYGTASNSGVLLTAGTHVMRVGIDGYGFLLDRLQITNEQTPYGGTPWAVPGTIQAEDFDNGGQGVAYNDTTAANEGNFYRSTGVDITSTYAGPNVGWTQGGEWMKYTINVAATDNYTVQAIAATPQGTGSVHFEIDGADVTGPMAIPNTGGWGSYGTASKSGVNITAGQHVLKVSIDGYGFLFDYIRIIPPAPAAPSGLTATAASTTQLNLAWTDNSSNETSFRVERKTGAGGTYAEVATVGAGVTSYSNTGLASNTQYFYRVRATNTGGDSAYSAEAGATTLNTPPSVSITSPASGAGYAAGASVTLTASASDADGAVTKVEFFNGTSLVGTVTAAPYNLTVSNAPAGSYTVTARATDNNGAQTTSAPISVTISLPTVTVTATDASASEQGPDAGAFTVTRAGATGLTDSPLTVSFTVGGTATSGTDYSTLSGAVTIPAGSASQSVTVTPVDDATVETGGETVVLTLSNNAAYQVGTPSSATVAIADNDTYPPTASITSPAGGTVFNVPASIDIAATAADADGTITKVEFFQGSTKLGEDTTSPYSYTWVNPAAGSYSLTARATDNAGATGTSALVTVVVNTPPAVSITSPANNTAVYAGASVQFTAAASDPDTGGTIAQVEFRRGTESLGVVNAPPYAFTWQNVPEGSYTITAVATDNRGAQTMSAAVHVAAADFTAARLDPHNRTGGGSVDLYSRNFNWALPVVSLSGRAGLDLGLSLSYNSLVWTKSGNAVLFDGDGGWPAPGFRLGFAVVQGKFYDTQAQKPAYLLITPSGARVSLRQRTDNTAVYEAGDSSYLQLTEEQNGSLTLVAPGGTRMSYWLVGGTFKCTEIKDSNGNLITVAYTSTGNIDNVTDTLGRPVDFDYYADGYLKEIKQTWHREVEGGSPVTETHRWAMFEYADSEVRTNFSDLAVAGPTAGQTFHALKRVTLADDSYYTFDYTSWGQISKIESHAQSGELLGRVTLNLPADETQSQFDCPRPTSRRDWAAYANGDTDSVPSQSEELVTSYEVTDGATWTTPEDNQPQTGRLSQMTSPDGTVYKEYAHSAGWDRGFVRLAEFWSGGMRKKWTSTAWTQDDEALPYMQNPRVRETNVYDSNEDGTPHSRRRTEISYIFWGLPEDVREYDTDGTTVLRRTHTEYKATSVDGDGAYALRRILGLPEKREVYGPEGGVEKLFSKVTYEYDLGGEFMAAPEGNPASVTQHDGANFGTGFNLRGNVCRVRRWDVSTVANAIDQTKSVAAETGYNTLGSAVFTRDAGGHQTSVSYADSDTGLRFAYPTHVTDPGGFTFSAWYNYDMGAVTRVETPKPAGTNDQPVVTRLYDAAGRPLQVSAGPGGTYMKWEYGASGLYVKQWTQVDTGKPETFVMTVTDGAGAPVGVLREHPGDGTGYAATRTEYDPVNREVKRYNPVEVAVDSADLSNARAWVPAGPDETRQGRAGWPYSATEYDWKGRVRREVNADGSDRLMDYEGCGCAGGEVVTTRGELVPTNAPAPAPAQGRRTQRVYHDILGRPLKTELLDWGGSVYSSTTTKYDALDRAVRVREYAGTAPAPADEPVGEAVGYQTTTMTYDGHGRLQTQHLPVYDPNTVVTYEYNDDDTVRSVTDPRGVLTTFTYNSRRLVTGVTYDPKQSGVPDTPDVTFDYDAAGNRTSMTDEAGSTSYQYYALSRLASETRQFSGITHRTYTLTYDYTLAGQLKSMTDPFGVTTSYNRDTVGQVTDVTGSGYPAIPQLANGVAFTSGIKYRAWGAIQEANYGDGRGMTADYDNRLRVTGFHMPGPVTMDKSYQYETDGGLRFAADQLDHAFDRSYTYDHAGRLTQAHTGEQTRGGTTDDGPYQQSYTYDPFGHGAGQTNLLWKQVVGGGPVHYSNDRRQGWNYDAAGGLTFDQLRHYVNDAAGRMKSFSPGIQSYAYDGEGQVARVTRQLEGTSVVYNLRSTVLGGAVVSQLKPQANALDARQDIISLGDGTEARRDVGVTGEMVTWSHEDPAGTTVQEGGVTSFGGPNATFLNPLVELDPVRASVPTADPAQFEEPPAPIDEASPEGRVYNNPMRPGVVCFNNHLRVDCEQMLLVIGSRTGRRSQQVDWDWVKEMEITSSYQYPWNEVMKDGSVIYQSTTNRSSVYAYAPHYVASGYVGGGFVGGESQQAPPPQKPAPTATPAPSTCTIEVRGLPRGAGLSPDNPLHYPNTKKQTLGLNTTLLGGTYIGYQVEEHATVSDDISTWQFTRTYADNSYSIFSNGNKFAANVKRGNETGNYNWQPEGGKTFYGLDAPGVPSNIVNDFKGAGIVRYHGVWNMTSILSKGKQRCTARWSITIDWQNGRFTGAFKPYHVRLP